MTDSNIVRNLQLEELDHLAALWYNGWQDGHAAVVPTELARLRTLESFKERLNANLANVRVVGPLGKPLGFNWVKDAELYQLYVAAEARGSNVAATLIDDAENQVRVKGYRTAWLACAIGNNRAAKFYEKRGWQLVGNMINELQTQEGIFTLETWRYEKDL
jgi:GNAT superfamily N-acetyltransferase